LKTGRAREALEPLERALVIKRENGSPPAQVANTAASLGEALIKAGGDRKRARALLGEARDISLGVGDADYAKLIDDYLKELDD
jgi:hypothetical protein